MAELRVLDSIYEGDGEIHLYTSSGQEMQLSRKELEIHYEGGQPVVVDVAHSATLTSGNYWLVTPRQFDTNLQEVIVAEDEVRRITRFSKSESLENYLEGSEYEEYLDEMIAKLKALDLPPSILEALGCQRYFVEFAEKEAKKIHESKKLE